MTPTEKTIRFLRVMRVIWAFFIALFMGISIHTALFTDQNASAYIAMTIALCAMGYSTILDLRWYLLVRELSAAGVEVPR